MLHSGTRVEESPVKSLLVHTSHYSLSSALIMVAGLVSFPILTRIFSVADYGVMSLVGSTLGIAVALGKVGVQHSIIRYQSEISSGNGRYTLNQLTSTTLLGMLGTSLLAALMIGIGSQLVPTHWLGDTRVARLLAIIPPIVIVQVLESSLINFVRAEQKTRTFLLYQVSKKYLGLALILMAVLLVSRSLTAFYVAMAITEITAVTILAVTMFRARRAPSLSQFSRPLYWELLRFGVPMLIGYELSSIILSVGDRYLIEGLMGDVPLGLYSTAYNLCQYVQSVFIASVSQAIMPIYMRMWDRNGREETATFVERSLRTYVLLGGPIIAGLAAVGPELLPALASDKYTSSVVILPWVIAGMAVDGLNPILGAGLFIHRKTRTIMSIVMSGAVLNVVLNVLLIPRMGIMAAAVATLISYAFTALGMGFAGRRLLPVAIPWSTMLHAVIASVAMLLAIRSLYPGHRLLTVGLRVLVGGAIYMVSTAVMDRDALAVLKKGVCRLRRSHG